MKRLLGSLVQNKLKQVFAAGVPRFRPVLLLLGSNAFATLIIAVGSFVVARIVTPVEFGRYSIATQITVAVYPILTLRYENALPLLVNRRSSSLLLTGCLLILVVITLLLYTLGMVGISIPAISAYMPSEIINLLPLIVFGAFSLALSSIFQSSALAHGTLSRLAIARVLRALTMVALQVWFALTLDATATWLLVGDVSANLAHAIFLASAFGLGGVFAAARTPWKKLWPRLLVLMRRYKEFPLITLPHNFVFSALGLIYASTLGAAYGAAALGQFYLMRKLVFGVLAIFNVAICQNAIAESAKVPRSKLFGVALRALILMGSVAAISAVVIALFGPYLFGLVVGAKWAQASIMAVASVALIIFEPVTSTFSFLPVFLRLQHIAFAVAVVQGCVGVAAIGTAAWLGWDVITAILASSLAVSMVMLSYILWLLIQAKRASKLAQSGF